VRCNDQKDCYRAQALNVSAIAEPVLVPLQHLSPEKSGAQQSRRSSG